MPATIGLQQRRIKQARRASAIGRALRNNLVYEWHLQGLTAPQISAQDGRSPKTIETLTERFDKHGTAAIERVLEQAPVAIIEGMLRRAQLAWRMAAMTAVHADTDSARISAIRTMLDADQRVLEVLQSTGHMPRELGTLRHLVDVRQVASTMIEAVRALEAGDATVAQVRETFEGLLAITDGHAVEIEGDGDEDLPDPGGPGRPDQDRAGGEPAGPNGGPAER